MAFSAKPLQYKTSAEHAAAALAVCNDTLSRIDDMLMQSLRRCNITQFAADLSVGRQVIAAENNCREWYSMAAVCVLTNAQLVHIACDLLQGCWQRIYKSFDS